MQVKQVPWWRRALNIALSGIRSGFGLFSRTREPIDETEPEPVAGHNEIREEETELTKYSPELNSIDIETASQVETAVTPDIEVVAVTELAAKPECAPEGTPEESAIAEPKILSDAPIVEPGNAPELEPEADVAALPEEASLDPEPTFEDLAGERGPALPVATAPRQESPVEPAIREHSEQVTEPQVTVENVTIDEVTPQAEAAISEHSAPETASPISDEMIGPAAEVAEDAIEARVEAAAVDLNADMEDQIVDLAIEQPMELNHSKSGPDAEQKEPEATAVPAPAAGEFANALESPAEEAAAVDEPAEAPTAAQHPSKPFIKLEAKEGEANASPFSVMVSEVYDGPLDLLLDLIRKQDIDIYDIPIARITAQFLAYVNQLKASDVDVAGEFIYTASLLIHIKSKMLLPRAPTGPDDAAEDPRRELVERLLEHERFKNAAQMLQQKQMLEAATWTNPGVRDFKEDAGAEPEIAADTVDLVRIFREILERARNRPILNVQEDSVTVGQMIQFLSRRLSMEDKPVALRKLLSHSRSERALIAMFLALLELVRLQAILLRQDLAFSEIFIKKHSNFESVMNEAVTHDDWR